MRLLFRTTVQNDPDMLSQPTQLAEVEAPVGVAVNVTVVPAAKLALHELEQPIPGGELLTVPVPDPAKSTVSAGWFDVPAKPGHPGTFRSLTVTAMVAVTMAPDELRFDVLLFVFTVAETKLPPQSMPAGDSRPVGVTVTTPGVFEAHVTWSVMSFCTAG